MLDREFRDFLECAICKAFEHSDDDKIKGFWCDGILLSEPDSAYSLKSVNDTRQVRLKAFIGRDGQTEYELTLKFGNKALSRFARNLDIGVCVSDADDPSWFDIDTKRYKMEIQLF
ncbi:MAG: hypothetical protein ACT6QS_01975 [Flavobacteriales bacterium]